MNEMQPASNPKPQETIRFRWSFVIFPWCILALALILTAVFVPRLGDSVAFSFSDAAATREISRTVLTGLLLGINLLFALVALGLVRLLITSSRYWSEDNLSFISRMARLLGNMPGLVQLVIVIAALYIMLYDIHGTMPVPFWLAALIVMLAGGIVIVTQFTGLYKASRTQHDKSAQEIKDNV